MDITIDQQVALDKALIPHASRLRIGKRNFRLRSNITSKKSTLQLVYDVLRLNPFYKAFLVATDVPEIYMQEFWAIAIVHHHSICFKMKNKKRIVNLEYFREMLHICLRLPNKTFDELLFEKEILAFLRYLGHNGEIKKITNAQILWEMHHKKNVDFAYLLWEDFVYQVEHKDAKKSNEMYNPRFTKVIIHFFMTKDPLIPRRNKFGAILHIELINEDVRNSTAYKEYYVVASGATPPKTKVSARKTQSGSDTTITPPMAAGIRLSTSAKGKQPVKSSKAKGLSVLFEVAMIEAKQIKLATKRNLQQTHISQASGSGIDEGTGILPGVLDVLTDESDEEIFWKSSDEDDDKVDDRSDYQEDEDDQDNDDKKDDDQDDNDDDQDTDNDDDDFVHPKLSIFEKEAKDEESFDPIIQTLENFDDKGNDDSSLSMNVGGEEGQDAEDDDKELYKDVNINLEGQDFARAVSSILGIVERYMDQRMNEAVKTASESAPAEEPMQTTQDLEEPSHQEFETGAVDDQPIAKASQHPECIQPWISDLAKQADSRSLFNELMDTLVDFLAFLMNQIKVDTLTPELLVGLSYELMKGSCKILVELEFFMEEVYKATTDQLDWNNPKGQQYLYNLLKPLPLIRNSRGRRVIPFDHFINNDLKYLHGGASSRKGANINSSTDLQSTRSLLEMSTQNVESSLSSNFRSSNGIITSIWIGSLYVEMITSYTSSKKATSRGFAFKTLKICYRFWHVEDLQLGVESYQKKLNLTKSDTDGTLNDVRTAMDDRLKGIRMKYLPQAIWRRSDKERAATMIQAIDK
uniref:Uncharacterized protein n=1 Tax=Tanacetum cinerariifolium TaxID=118510 RepID=A0A6L2K3L5_TANCI|nr:hypothetical protein [Tanacetum cinerariifolium]